MQQLSVRFSTGRGGYYSNRCKSDCVTENKYDVRPIAVGDCLRRLTAKLACRQLKVKISNYLSPYQNGVATPGGAELMTHLIQACLEKHPDWIVIKTDAKNAFSVVD